MTTNNTELIKRLQHLRQQAYAANRMHECAAFRNAADALQALQTEVYTAKLKNTALIRENAEANEEVKRLAMEHEPLERNNIILQLRLTALEKQEMVTDERIKSIWCDLTNQPVNLKVARALIAAGATPQPPQADAPHAREMSKHGCQCEACRRVKHASDCNIHNAPAYPNGHCDCEALPARELSDAELEQIVQSAIRVYMQNYPSAAKNACVEVAHEVARAVLAARSKS